MTIKTTSTEAATSVDKVSTKLYLKFKEVPLNEVFEVLIIKFKEESTEKTQAGVPVTALTQALVAVL